MNNHLNFKSAEEAAHRLTLRKCQKEGYQFIALHTYHDSNGNPLYWRIRLQHPVTHQKWIRPLHQDINNRFLLSEPAILNGKKKPLYGLSLLTKFPNAKVFIVEGEYPADKANQFFNQQCIENAYIAVTSGSATSAEQADWEPLAKRDCIIWPDNDASGLKYAEEVRTKLESLGSLVEIIDATKINLSEGDDCIDWLQINHSATMPDILSLSRLQKSPITPETTAKETEIITRLATLSHIEYDRIRITEAKNLNIRPATLDLLIRSSKMISQKENKLPFPEIIPWHESINPNDLLTEICKTIQRFIVCPDETAHAATLWVVMTWFIDVIHVAPFAVITAPEKRCGKSQLLFLLGRLVNRPLSASNITVAALFRSIDIWQPTLLIDEADTFMRENEELRGIINCGHTRDLAKIIRVVGDDFTPTTFSVWGAKAFAGIGYLPDTIMDRSIKLELRRKSINENVERLRHAETHVFKTLSSKLARFSKDYSHQILQAKPTLPDSLNDRAQDNWEPLLAIADIAGNEWPRLAMMAATKISGENEHYQSISIQLLSDIQTIFESKLIDKISTAALINELCHDEEKPWATYNRESPIKPRQVANQLREFGITSSTIRFSKEITAKGYSKLQFTDTFARYLVSIRNTVTSP